VAKSAKNVKSDRQAVIEKMRKQQRGAEKKRGYAIIGVCMLVALLMIGAAAYKPISDWWDGRQLDDVAVDEIGASAEAACQDITTKKADGTQNHVPPGTPVEYTTAPPAFGAHWNEAGVAPAPFERKLYTEDDRPELESLVHNLEHGYTILWYDETVADDSSAMDDIKAIAEKFDETDNDMRDKFIAAPWLSSDENGKSFPEGQHIAFTHWSIGGEGQTDTSKQVGAFQYCSAPSGAALEAFMDKYPYFDSPEPNAM
jgi:hypothetical protein